MQKKYFVDKWQRYKLMRLGVPNQIAENESNFFFGNQIAIRYRLKIHRYKFFDGIIDLNLDFFDTIRSKLL